jgi:hypothetical protein
MKHPSCLPSTSIWTPHCLRKTRVLRSRYLDPVESTSITQNHHRRRRHHDYAFQCYLAARGARQHNQCSSRREGWLPRPFSKCDGGIFQYQEACRCEDQQNSCDVYKCPTIDRQEHWVSPLCTLVYFGAGCAADSYEIQTVLTFLSTITGVVRSGPNWMLRL